MCPRVDAGRLGSAAAEKLLLRNAALRVLDLSDLKLDAQSVATGISGNATLRYLAVGGAPGLLGAYGVALASNADSALAALAVYNAQPTVEEVGARLAAQDTERAPVGSAVLLVAPHPAYL